LGFDLKDGCGIARHVTLKPPPHSCGWAGGARLGDLIPQFAVRWNAGVNNYMAYLTGDIPVGVHAPPTLPISGSVTAPSTVASATPMSMRKPAMNFRRSPDWPENFANTSTNYTNGIDWHLDWGLSQFLTKQWQVGLVGYFYDQLTPDSGCAPVICPFESRVIGVGPQIGYLFPVGDMQGYLNLKGYGEFDNNARPAGAIRLCRLGIDFAVLGALAGNRRFF
jgi:hypothetical protein